MQGDKDGVSSQPDVHGDFYGHKSWLWIESEREGKTKLGRAERVLSF